MINLIALSTFFVSLGYGIGNILGGHVTLACIDLTYSLASLVVFLLHRLGYYRHAQVHLLISSSLFCSVVNFLSYNVAEYYLLCVLIVSILVFHHIWTQTIISVCLVIVILLPKYFVAYLPYSYAVGQDRLLVNVPIAVLFIFTLVRHFKSVQQQYQEEIKQQHIRLEALNRDKEQLFAIVAHDIRSPLIATSQILQLVAEDKVSVVQRDKIIGQIKTQLNNLTDNVDNLLHWSSQNLQGFVSRPSLFSLKTLLVQLIDTMKTQSQEKNITFQLSVDPQLTVYADIEQTRIIFRNLLSNALKFSYVDSKIDIAATAWKREADICITDYGMGMSDRQVSELFTTIQNPSYGTSGERGTGLGLVLVRNLLQINAGSISVQSIEKKGTTFHFKLPSQAIDDGKPTAHLA